MAMDYFLKQINPANNATPLRIFLDKNETIIGRRSIISLTGFNKVSRKHAKFLNKNGRWFVSDLVSLNKLYVNFKEVSNEWTPIEIGDIIGFGTPSYNDDGGLVCVFAAKHRIKHEIADEIESPDLKNICTENVQNFSNVKVEKPLKVKQEFSPSENEDCRRETSISKPEYILQTEESAFSALNTAIISNGIIGNVSHQSNVIMPQNKSTSNSKRLKPVIKTEPIESDDCVLLEIKKTSINRNLVVNQKLEVENSRTVDNFDTTICDVKLPFNNNIKDRKQSLGKDMLSNIRKTNTSSNEYFEEVNEKNDLIPETKTLKTSKKLQAMENVNSAKTKDRKKAANCSMRLVKDDSKYLQKPPEKNYSKILTTVEKSQHFPEQSMSKTFKDAKKTEMNCSKRSEKQNIKSHRKRKNLEADKQKRKNTVKLPLKLKINKNRILSSSSEMSSDESDCEKKDLNILNKKTSDKKGKSKGQTGDKKRVFLSRRNNGSLDETSQVLKVSKKRKQDFSENHSKKRKKSKKGCEKQLNCYDSECLDLYSSANASGKESDTRNREILRYSRDESSFCVERSGCSKYWTPEYNEFETGEVRESLKHNTLIKTKQTAGRTLLTDPKPIEFRPRKMRGREEWFKEQTSYSIQDCDQNEKISEKVEEEIPNTLKQNSKLSSSLRNASSKEHSSVVREKISTELSLNSAVASSKGNTAEPLSKETFLSGGNLVSSARKNSTETLSRKTFLSSGGNLLTSARKNSTETLSRESLSSGENFLNSPRRNSAEIFSSKALSKSEVKFLNTASKDFREIFSSEQLPVSQGNFLSVAQKHSATHSSNETLVASSENSSRVSQRNSAEIISTESVTLRENSFIESRGSRDKSKNSPSLKSAAVTIQMDTVPSVPKRRNSSGCRTRFLVEIQTNAAETLKNKRPTAKETFPQCSEKNYCTTPITVNPTNTINDSGYQRAEEIKVENENSKNKSSVSPVSPNCKTVSLPESFSSSSFENNKDIISRERKTVKENELFAKKGYDETEIEPNLRDTYIITSDTKYLAKQLFSKNDKTSYDRKIAVVTPNKKLNQPETSASYFQKPVKETITNRVHSTYILSPEKTLSNPIQANSDSTNVEDASSSPSEDSKDAKFRSHYLIKSILQWNPKWLEEQAKNKRPPPMVSKGCSALPLRFSSYDTYIKSFYPMISLEIWDSLFRESKPFWLRKEVKNAFYFKVRSNSLKHNLIELQCESNVNENLSFFPSEGNVILLGFNEFGDGLENSLLGYIHRHKVEGAHEIEKTKEWQNVPEKWQVTSKLWTFSVYIKKTKRNFSIGSVCLAYGILNIKNKLQLANALGDFKDSPIQSDILQPTKEMFSFSYSISKLLRPQLIQTVSEEIKNENPHGKLILINAPVATGKTGAIIGIVEKLLFTNTSRIKILLCALSDFTVDEIGLRLVELNERYNWRGNSIKFVRFGLSENVPAKLQAYTLERKVLKMFKEQHKQEFQDRENELKVLEDKINEVLFKEQLKSNNKFRYRKRNDEALKHLMDQLQYLKENSPYKSIDPVIHSNYESSILDESDVVLTTLHCCTHPQMRKFFTPMLEGRKEGPHACCIIDEISQCTELEVLQCLHPEINRLVLVGDLQQLQPAVSSKYAIKCGFKRSMMERILKLFNVQFSFTPPLSLAEQHRMQSQICHFPSKYFYKERLLTAAGVDERYKYCPLRPFVVYDILEKEMPNPSVSIEHSEPFILASICAQILQTVPTASLGVIVFCEELAAMYRIPLSQGNAALKEIEVNTVENFQGIEKDVIIISCVNPSLFTEHDNYLSSENKMNVAITRARQSLIICGHVSSVTQFEHWAALVNDAKQRKNFISVSSLRKIPFVTMKSICRMG